jgi:hypothetical protein
MLENARGWRIAGDPGERNPRRRISRLPSGEFIRSRLVALITSAEACGDAASTHLPRLPGAIE